MHSDKISKKAAMFNDANVTVQASVSVLQRKLNILEKEIPFT